MPINCTRQTETAQKKKKKKKKTHKGRVSRRVLYVCVCVCDAKESGVRFQKGGRGTHVLWALGCLGELGDGDGRGVGGKDAVVGGDGLKLADNLQHKTTKGSNNKGRRRRRSNNNSSNNSDGGEDEQSKKNPQGLCGKYKRRVEVSISDDSVVLFLLACAKACRRCSHRTLCLSSRFSKTASMIMSASEKCCLARVQNKNEKSHESNRRTCVCICVCMCAYVQAQIVCMFRGKKKSVRSASWRRCL